MLRGHQIPQSNDSSIQPSLADTSHDDGIASLNADPSVARQTTCPAANAEGDEIRHSSTQPVVEPLEATTHSLIIVPRSQRRGLLGQLSFVPEVERPYQYSNLTKWGITATVSIAASTVPFGSTIFFPALGDLSKDFRTQPTIANLSVALYMVAMSVFPLWWSSFSEEFGRRSIYLISFFLFIIACILCAVSTNIAMLITFRVMAGGCAASVQAVGAGTIADVWESKERGRAMSLFYLGPLLGPLLAPIIGGVLSQSLGWRSTMWFLSIFGLVAFLLLLFMLPETLVSSRHVDRRLQSTRPKTFLKQLQRIFVEPLGVLLFLRFPPILITVILAAIAFGALFIVNIAIQQKYADAPYSFKQTIVGLLYLPTGIGSTFASFLGGKWLDYIMAREAKKKKRYDVNGQLLYLPEDRMKENMWLANAVYPLGLLLFGWTLEYGIFWFVPSIGSFLFGLSSMLVFSAATTMLTEFVRKRSSAGVAVNNFVRNILSCIGTVVASPWIDAIGVGYVSTAVALFCLIVGYSAIWLLRRNAEKWRDQMDQALEER